MNNFIVDPANLEKRSREEGGQKKKFNYPRGFSVDQTASGWSLSSTKLMGSLQPFWGPRSLLPHDTANCVRSGIDTYSKKREGKEKKRKKKKKKEKE